jgi:tetratricopeptide (TPR) repeat protein
MALFAAALFALGACAQERRTTSASCSCEEDGAKAVDQLLLAWLSKARTLHHLADLAEDEGSLDKAIAPLEQLVGGTLPRGQPAEAAEVLADTYARLAELRTRKGDYARAEQDVSSGLRFAPEPTYFRGHLFEVRGLIHQKESDELAKAGKVADAKAAREKSLAASLEAVTIQDRVIKSTLGDAGPATRD